MCQDAEDIVRSTGHSAPEPILMQVESTSLPVDTPVL